MTRTVFRLTQRRYLKSALSGTGSLKWNGRWHRAGIPVVYSSESAAVALLEVMVHVEALRLITMDLIVVPCRFDERDMETVEAYAGPAGLPEKWRTFPWSPLTQDIGQTWFKTGRSLVLEVPSAVMPRARNYLLNPRHPSFGSIAIGTAEPLEVDPRLGARETRP